LVPEVTMSVEEYLALIESSRPVAKRQAARSVARKVVKKGKKDPKMARALKKANAIGRTKNGKLRKGYTQARIMKKAHQLRRKM
jgi:hypothetical protein